MFLSNIRRVGGRRPGGGSWLTVRRWSSCSTPSRSQDPQSSRPGSSSRKGWRDAPAEHGAGAGQLQGRRGPPAEPGRGRARPAGDPGVVAAAAAEPGHGGAGRPGANGGRHGTAGHPLHPGQRGVSGHRAGPLPVRSQRPVRAAVRAGPRRARVPCAAAERARHVRLRRGLRADAARDRGRARHRGLAARAELVRGQAGYVRRQLPRLRAVGAGHGPAAGTGRHGGARRPARLQPGRVP